MWEFEKLHSALLHINHASILIKSGDEYLLCDPWFISPAFNNWTQNPPPPAEFIQFILALDKSKLAVVTSHGHDDHIDDYFIQHHLAACRFHVPAFRSPGLQDRIERITGRKPIVLRDEPTDSPPFRLSRTVNDEFTGFDSIINIEAERFVIIHANDNWHQQPKHVIDRILSVRKRSRGPFYYLAQLGIADCFPQCYPQFSYKEMLDVVRDRLEIILKATEANMEALGLSRLYTYANQSQIISEFAKGPFVGIDIVKQLISDRNRNSTSQITQLFPGDYLDLTDAPQEPKRISSISNSDLLQVALRRLEEKANSYLKDVRKPGPISFRIVDELDNIAPLSPGVTYATSRVIWQRIICGSINLETISIGGGGIVIKNPREFNIREVHEGIGKFGYIVQNEFSKVGLAWLFRE